MASRTVARLDSLTGLRFFAALAVFLLHAGVLFNGTRLLSTVNVFAAQGKSGVSFFFILSGFVLTWSHRERDLTGRFYRRRAARILPAYWVSVLLALPVIQAETGLGSARLTQTAFSATLLQSWIPSQSWYFGGNWVGWSLADEAFFYLLFPYLLARLAGWTSGRLRVLVIACVAVPFLAAALAPASLFGYWAVYIFPITRLPEFVLGICLAMLVRRLDAPRLPLAPALVVAVAAWLMAGQASGYWGWIAVTGIPFAGLIVAAAQSDVRGTMSGLRGERLVRLGEWSFAFYLLHQLVVRLTVAWWGDSLSTAAALGLFATDFALSLAGAAALFRWIERPLERRLRGSEGDRHRGEVPAGAGGRVR